MNVRKKSIVEIPRSEKRKIVENVLKILKTAFLIVVIEKKMKMKIVEIVLKIMEFVLGLVEMEKKKFEKHVIMEQ
ncbi:hypothetical protein IJM86_00115 [bacterium]|nr:hypothetical protein [bacterium]